MQHYVGLDVSLSETAICVVDQDGHRHSRRQSGIRARGDYGLAHRTGYLGYEGRP